MLLVKALYLFLVAGALLVGASAIAEPGSAREPLGAPSKKLKSRVCGLILLSAGREAIREGKAPLKSGNPVDGARYETGIAQLVRASILLADGRDIADKAAARKLAAGAAPLEGPTRAAAIATCEKLFIGRAVEADFDRSDSTLADAIAFAKFTADTEP